MKLHEFLVKAKISTYASGDDSKRVNLPDGSYELIFSEGDFKYRDRYFGGTAFSGEEVVWKKDRVIWSMNYYGTLLCRRISSKKLNIFLRDALALVEETSPFRGPKLFKKDDYEYVTEFSGDTSHFSGTETIYLRGKKVYELHFHGGSIKA